MCCSLSGVPIDAADMVVGVDVLTVTEYVKCFDGDLHWSKLGTERKQSVPARVRNLGRHYHKQTGLCLEKARAKNVDRRMWRGATARSPLLLLVCAVWNWRGCLCCFCAFWEETHTALSRPTWVGAEWGKKEKVYGSRGALTWCLQLRQKARYSNCDQCHLTTYSAAW